MLAQDYRAIGHALSHRAYVYDLFAVELGDEWAMEEWRRVQASSVRAYPRGLVVHGLVGNTPVAGIASIARGLITRNMNLAKAAARDPLSPLHFAQICAQVEPEHPLVRGLSIGYWEHADPVAERATCLADAVCLWGGDEGIAAMRASVRPGVPLLEFGPKRSLAVIDLDRVDVEAAAARLATEVSFYEQEACVSPQRLYVKGGFERLREPLTCFLGAAARRAPKVTAEPDAHAHVSFARLEAAYRGWPMTCGRDWTVIEALVPGEVREHPLGRTLYVHPVSSLEQVAAQLDETVQTVGVFPWELALSYRDAWARRGISRIVELGLSRHPRKGFSHDGMRALSALVRFVSVERPLHHYYKYLDAPYPEGTERELFFHD
jgi:long-chain-fatty-acyl-CoA reductase